MNPIHLHELALDHQAELLAEAARERLARSAGTDEAHLGTGTARGLRTLVRHGLARIGRFGGARQTPLPPRHA